MSDASRDPKKPARTDWLEELRQRLADWLGALIDPPVPVPVPVRRRR